MSDVPADLPPEIRARIDKAVADAVAAALTAGMQRRDAILRHDAAIGRATLAAYLAFASDRPVADAIAVLSASPLESDQRCDVDNVPHPGMEPAR